MPPTQPSGSQHWEGDGTLHSYCYDYMLKRGWTDTARAFARDAGINEEEWKGPPIEAPQGLLYEWWSVFWDVFISRSQKTGQRNVLADNYVEAMRQKRDPLLVQFAGQLNQPPITLPRSLALPPRGPPAGDPGPAVRYVSNPAGQMRPLQPGDPGRPLPPGSRPPGPPQQFQYHPQPPFQQQPGPQHLQGHPQHSQPPGPPGIPPGPSYQSSLPPQQPLQSYQHPSQPLSAHSSPHLAHMAVPYRNQGPPPPQLQQRQQQEASQNHNAMVYQQAMQAVGLGGREPESLNGEEQSYIHAHLRKTGTAGLPPTPQQQQFRPPPQRNGSLPQPQRMHPGEQQQQGRIPSNQYPLGSAAPPPQILRHQQEQNHQQMMYHQQQQQELQREHQQQQQQHGAPPRQPPPGVQMHPQPQQLQYPSSQVASPASPNYAESPYNPPLNLPSHPSQASPPPSFAPPPPSTRPGPQPKGRGGGAVSSKMSPAGSKRGGQLEDPSPRSRKRVKGSKDEDGGMPTPETPRFDLSGAPSPGGQVQGLPYQPSRSPQDMSTRGALEALQASNARVAQQRLDLTNGDGGPHLNGGGENGTISRPSSSASNYLNANAFPPDAKPSISNSPHNSYLNPSSFAPDAKPSPSASPHPLSMDPDGGGGFLDGPPGVMHISLPPPMSSFMLNPNDATPGGSRPFAGHPQVISPMPLSNGGAPSAPLSDPSSVYQFTGSDDDFLGGELSGLDFENAFSNFIDDSMFKDDRLPEVMS